MSNTRMSAAALLFIFQPRWVGRGVQSANSYLCTLQPPDRTHSRIKYSTASSASVSALLNSGPRHAFRRPRSSPSNIYIPHRSLHGSIPQKRADQVLTEELRKLTQGGGRDGATTGPMLGPFMMPRGRLGERPLEASERQGWKQAGWGERRRRVFRNGRNLAVVSVGGCIGLLVVYSITSELFAPSSPTNLMLATIETIECSESLKSILRTPYIFHTSQHASSKHTHLPHPITHQNSSHTVELRFLIEGSPIFASKRAEWWELEWWKSTMKKWISPLITSEVKQPVGIAKPPWNSETVENSATRNGWLVDVIGMLIPRTLSNRKEREAQSGSERPGWLERRAPSLGTFEHGEVTAEIVKDTGGGWTYKSLYIDFPDAQHAYYRLDVLNELRKVQAHATVEERAPKRYRFWSRRINV
ncbi:hypothetical protein CROQUDRAFT_658881 [Cronartium quercuum f. sp. fusiforme G11]|uniref:Mitochondrial import inner membrane translocase subunit Tim21 n=1 Tax=Cronartium quercuum f. sp. fusiforme G11 TaxID=708437 RepID=A0A9P6NEG7_9BASI|nr:hypothetical protein CROQUDRAFT_658881 [Cronartium quercuum f. sp. fusiforme G11]